MVYRVCLRNPVDGGGHCRQFPDGGIHGLFPYDMARIDVFGDRERRFDGIPDQAGDDARVGRSRVVFYSGHYVCVLCRNV